MRSWIFEEAKGYRIFDLVVKCLSLILVYDVVICFLMEKVGLHVPPVPGDPLTVNWTLFVFLLPCAALAEEILFRLPLAFCISRKWSFRSTIIVAVILSIVFGWSHGSIHHIFIQGFAGFMWSLLFMKCGGMQKRYVKALVVTTFGHYLFNALLCIVLISHGSSTF